jgi:hypothetical protein
VWRARGAEERLLTLGLLAGRLVVIAHAPRDPPKHLAKQPPPEESVTSTVNTNRPLALGMPEIIPIVPANPIREERFRPPLATYKVPYRQKRPIQNHRLFSELRSGGWRL